MAHLIDKDALVAEIENIRKHYIERDDFDNGWNFALNKVLSFLDTIEVKDVDLEKEYEEFVVDDPIFGNFITNDTMGRELAKHFFELGMSISNKAQKGE